MANVGEIVTLIDKRNAEWLRVNQQPCMHTFIGDFYVNLCLWKWNDKSVISIDVDDMKKCISDIIAEDIFEGHEYFDTLYSIFLSSKSSAKNIALQD